MKLTLTQFGGVAPKQNPRYLADVQAQAAVDCAVNTGPLRPLANPLAIGVSLALGTQSIYRFGQDNPDTTQWLSWSGDVDVAKSLINEDTTERTYFTGTDIPRVTDTTLIPGSRMLGVPVPTVAPDVTEGVFLPKRMPAEVFISSNDLEQMDLSMGIAFSGTAISLDGSTIVRAYPLTRSVIDVSRAINEDVPNVTAEVSGTGVLVKSDETHSGKEFGLVVNVAGNFDNTFDGAGSGASSSTTTQTVVAEGEAVPFEISATTLKDMTWSNTGMMYEEIGALTTHYNILYPWLRYRFSSNASWTYLVVGSTLPYVQFNTTLKTYGTLGEIGSALNGAGLTTRIVGTSLHVSGVAELEYRSTTWKYYVNHLSDRPDDYNWVSPGPSSLVEEVVVDTPAAPACVTIPLDDLNATAPFGFRFSVDGGPKLLFPMPEQLAADDSNSVTIVSAINNSGVNAYVDVTFDRQTGLKLCSKTAGESASIQAFLLDPSTSTRLEGAGYEEDPGTKEARVYTYTFVNDWGEESAPYSFDPMPASCTVEVYAEQGAIVGTPTTAPAGSYVTKKRIYRSVVAQGTPTFLYVGETALGTSLFNDDKSADLLGEECPSLYWTPPKPNLHGLVSLPNGILAGFVGNDVYLSEPYRPFAWPEVYSVSVAYPVVGLGALDTTVVVLTKGKPYFIQGSHPDSMVAVEADVSQACVSKRSIVSTDGVVFYASPDGLVGLATNGSKIVTQQLFDRAQWQSLQPETIHAYAHDGVYVAFFGNTGGGFLFDIASASFMLHGVNASAGYSDLRRDTLFVLSGTSLGKWGEGTPRTYTWRSKLFTLPRPTHMASFRVGAEAYPVEVVVQRDGAVIHTQTVNNEQPCRLPPGLGREWDIQVTNNSDIYQIEVGQAVEEMTRAG